MGSYSDASWGNILFAADVSHSSLIDFAFDEVIDYSDFLEN